LNRESLKVAFNATPLLSPVTGIGNYIVELGAALAASGMVDPYSFYRYRWRHEAPRPPEQDLPGKPSFANRIKPFVPLRGAIRQAAHHLGFAGGLRRHRIDLYHEQNYVPLSYDVPVVVTIHDLSWIRYPESHPTDRVRWLARGLPKAIDRSEAILVDSDFIRHEVLTTFGIDTERVHTAYLGVAPDFRPRTAAETSSALASFGLAHGSYLLTVSTIEPRKNLRHILEAFAMLPTAVRERFPLVVAGAKGWHSSGLVARLRRLGDRQVRFLGHVDRSVLPHLYAGAGMFAFPSLYEGFGLPPLEAMASGVPVIVSDRASLPEVVGGAGETMNPEDPEDTAARLLALLEDSDRRRAMTVRGLERAATFSWQGCAEVTYAIYCSVLGRIAPGTAAVRRRSFTGMLGARGLS
jgi:glycosyltransferase involved in cell wall biosynthesis